MPSSRLPTAVTVGWENQAATVLSGITDRPQLAIIKSISSPIHSEDLAPERS